MEKERIEKVIVENEIEIRYICRGKFNKLRQKNVDLLTEQNIIYKNNNWYSRILKESARQVCSKWLY